MPVTRFNSNFRLRSDVLDQITPKNLVQRDISAPNGKWKPAAWLPVQFTKDNIQAGSNAFVISSGKVVAMDTESRIIPAGLIRTWSPAVTAGLAAATILTYTATDADWGVIDLVTGAAVTGAVSYTGLDVAEALVERGLVLEQDVLDASGAVPPTTDAHVGVVTGLFISPPVGVAAYDMYVWSGLPEDGDQVYTNLSYQHAVQFLTEGQFQLPQLTAASAATDAVTPSAEVTAVAADGDMVGATEYWDATNLAALTRYAGSVTAASSVVAYGLDPAGTGDQFRVAKNTDRTPLTCDTAGVLVRERPSIDLISVEGDWYLDDALGVLFLHSDTWATGVADVATWTFSYNYYDTLAATAHRHVHFDDVARPGRRVCFDAQSNFREAVEGTDPEFEILGQVLRVDTQPALLLSSVKTAWNFSNAPSTFQMPGSATKGFTDLITLSEELVADKVVILNVRI